MNRIYRGVAGLTICCAVLAAPVSAQTTAQAPEAPEVLQGLDPVVLVEGKESFGKSAFSSVYDGFTYTFANAENKATFDKAPAKFAVQNHGTCARMGGAVTGNPDLFAVHDGRIYLFGSEDCVKRFKAEPAKFVADPKPVPAISAQSAAAALALLDKAAAGFGGADRVDGLKALKTVVVQQPPPPAAGSTAPPRPPSTTTTVVAPPGRTWQEFKMGDMGGGTMVVTPSVAYRLTQGGVRPLNVQLAGSLVTEAERTPLFIVRGRRQPGMKVWDAGASTVDGTAVSVVGYAFDEERGTLAIDPVSGKILSMSFYGRGQGGMYGDVTQTYGAFKDAGGLILPYSYSRTFNGQPYGTPVVYERIEVNPPTDALFAPPGK